MKFKILLLLALNFFFWNCEKQPEKINETKSSFSDYYEFSEMALLMEKMYEDLNRTKVTVINKDSIGEFPTSYYKIHTAEMSADFKRNDEFKMYSDVFLSNLKKLHELDVESELRKPNFNNVVNSCITCHKSDSGCMGPVSRISKLLID